MMDYDMFVPGNHEFNYGMDHSPASAELPDQLMGTETESSVGCGHAPTTWIPPSSGGETTQLEAPGTAMPPISHQ